MPEVSICVSTFNRKESLQVTIESILNQSFKYFELIIVDDFSTDGTEEFIKNKILNTDYRIKYIRHNTNKGLAATRNSAINIAEGMYFTFCDDDDTWHENFLENMILEADKLDKESIFIGSVQTEDKKGYNVRLIPDLNTSLLDCFRKGFTPPVAAQFYYTTSLRKIAGYNEAISAGVDHDLWVRLLKLEISVFSVPCAISYPNMLKRSGKMTYNYNLRMKGIQHSLSIWENDIVDALGNSFYKSFCISYLKRESTKFLLFFLSQKNLINGLKVLKDCSLRLNYLQIFKSIVKQGLYNIISSDKKLKMKPYNPCL